MFIRKWRYLQNLENARIEGIREGKREENKQKFTYVEYLEEENKALQDKLAAANKELTGYRVEALGAAAKMAENAKKQMNKDMIEAFAQELACCQKLADVAYYTNGDQEESDRMVDKALMLKELASKMGICADMYERAYQIYDFRNSGKKGYALENGKIVKVEQEAIAPVNPFLEERVQETEPENCQAVPDAADEEAPF